MRTSTIRRLAAPALVALIVLPGLAGCSDDGGDDDTADRTTTEASDDATTTTTAADGSTTTGADDEDETSEGDGSTESTAADPPDEGQEGTVEADEEEPDVNWTRNATPYRGDDGKRVAYLCPPDGELKGVWGTDVYTDDSSVCSAAVHAGLINLVEGGRVVIEIAPGEDFYEGSEANDVTSQEYGEPWDGSFTFPEG